MGQHASICWLSIPLLREGVFLCSDGWLTICHKSLDINDLGGPEIPKCLIASSLQQNAT